MHWAPCFCPLKVLTLSPLICGYWWILLVSASVYIRIYFFSFIQIISGVVTFWWKLVLFCKKKEMLSLPSGSHIIWRIKIDLNYIFNFVLFINLMSLFYCSFEVVQTLDKEKHPVDGPFCYYLFNTLLFCLLVLHIYWWALMYRMLVKQIKSRGKLSEDVRSGK